MVSLLTNFTFLICIVHLFVSYSSENRYNRRKFGITPISQELITLQQQVADKFYELKLIPKQINVKEAMLTPEQYAAFSPKIK